MKGTKCLSVDKNVGGVGPRYKILEGGRRVLFLGVTPDQKKIPGRDRGRRRRGRRNVYPLKRRVFSVR